MLGWSKLNGFPARVGMAERPQNVICKCPNSGPAVSLPASVIVAQTGSNFEMSHVLLLFSTVTRTLLAENSGSGLSLLTVLSLI